jgi:hypothetical protein
MKTRPLLTTLGLAVAVAIGAVFVFEITSETGDDDEWTDEPVTTDPAGLDPDLMLIGVTALDAEHALLEYVRLAALPLRTKGRRLDDVERTPHQTRVVDSSGVDVDEDERARHIAESREPVCEVSLPSLPFGAHPRPENPGALVGVDETHMYFSNDGVLSRVDAEGTVVANVDLAPGRDCVALGTYETRTIWHVFGDDSHEIIAWHTADERPAWRVAVPDGAIVGCTDGPSLPADESVRQIGEPALPQNACWVTTDETEHGTFVCVDLLDGSVTFVSRAVSGSFAVVHDTGTWAVFGTSLDRTLVRLTERPVGARRVEGPIDMGYGYAWIGRGGEVTRLAPDELSSDEAATLLPPRE